MCGGLIIATDESTLLHTPPVTLTDTVAVAPLHITADDVAVGVGFTVMFFVLRQPYNEYVIVALPAATPVTTPVAEPTVAVDALLLLHVPPASVFVNVVDADEHTVLAPVIVAGIGVTETTVVV
jgi:hypothetical protein